MGIIGTNQQLDAIALGLEERDLLIIRTEQRIPGSQLRAFREEVCKRNPDWKGALITLGLDQSIEKLPHETLRAFYEILKRQFEDWEQWAKQFESAQAMCVRCGQALGTKLVKRKERRKAAREAAKTKTKEVK